VLLGDGVSHCFASWSLPPPLPPPALLPPPCCSCSCCRRARRICECKLCAIIGVKGASAPPRDRRRTWLRVFAVLCLVSGVVVRKVDVGWLCGAGGLAWRAIGVQLDLRGQLEFDGTFCFSVNHAAVWL